MKFVITKDEHLQLSFRNKYRKPGWENDVFNKHQYIINYMKANDIKIKLTTGDILDKQTGWSFIQYLKNKEILQMYKDNGIEIYSIAGNHDMIEGKTDIDNSVFKEFINQGLIKYNKIWEFDDIIFIAKDYRNIDIDISKDQFINEIVQDIENLKIKNKNLGLILHQNVTPDSKRITEFTYEELSKLDLKVIISGHYHIGYPTQEINGTLFINPWNLWRVVRDYDVKENLHTPEFVVFDSSTFKYEHVIVPHKAYTDAFDISKVDVYKNIKKEVFSFFNEITLDNFHETDEKNILEKIKEDFGSELDPKLVQEVFKELKQKFESLE